MKTVTAPDQMLYCIGHDIKTPLSAVIGYTVLLEHMAHDPAKVCDYAAKIRASGDMLLSMVDDVLGYAGLNRETGTVCHETFSLRWFAEEVVSAVEYQVNRKKQNLTLNISSDRDVTADKGRLMRIVLNLLSNAVKYTPENGNISLDIIHSRDRLLEVLVKDDGIGMSREFLEKIYEPYAREGRAAVPGTGLGMAIVREMVTELGGRIEIKSRPGDGTAVKVILNVESD